MTSSHSNKVTIKCGTIKTIDYIAKSLVITSGQPSSQPANISQSDDTWSVTMECGRKGDRSVAGQFTSLCGGKGHITCPTAISDASPSKLNFFFGTTITFTIGGKDYSTNVYLGQGHRSLRNNWWIGGPNIANNSSHAVLTIFSSTNIVQVYTISGGISDFSLTAWF
jgi:hypothetical protein